MVHPLHPAGQGPAGGEVEGLQGPAGVQQLRQGLETHPSVGEVQFPGIRKRSLNLFIKQFKPLSLSLPEADVLLVLHQSHHGPVHGLVVGGVADVEVHQGAAPLLHQQLQAVLAAAGDAAAGDVEILDVPAGKTDQGGVGDSLAAPDIQDLQLVGLLQYSLDLAVVHAVEVAPLVHPDGELLQVGEAGRRHLLPHGNVVQAQHGVGRSELSESGAAFLDLLDVDEYCVSGGRGNVGHVQHNQTLGVLLKLMKV